MPPSRLSANVWKFYVFSVLQGIVWGLCLPILVLFFIDRGLSLEQFMILMAIMNFTIFAMEIPGGIVADRFSRKWSIFAGRSALTLSFALMLLTTDMILLGVAFALYGIGESLISGADSALLYDSLKLESLQDRFQDTFGNTISIRLGMMVVGTIMCGYLVGRFDLAIPLWAGLALTVVGLVPTILLVEPPIHASEEQQARTFRGEVLGYWRHTVDSFRLIVRDPVLMLIIFINITIIRLCLFSDRPFAQPYLRTFDYSDADIGYLYTLFIGVTAVFAKFSRRIVGWVGGTERSGLVTVALMSLISLVAMVQAPIGVVLVVALVGLNTAKGLAEPFIQTAMNNRLTSDKRASCLSMGKMGMNLMGVFMGPMFGWLADTYSLGTSLTVYQWIFGPMLAVGILWAFYGLRRSPSSPSPA